MSNRSLAAGVFRAWGLMWWIYVLIGLPQFVNGMIRSPYRWSEKGAENFYFSSQAISLGCQVAIGLFLVVKAGWLATIVFPTEQEFHSAIGADDLRTVLFSAVGLYFVLDGARHIAVGAYQLLGRPRLEDRNAVAYLWEKAPETLASGLAGTLAGAYVLLRRGDLRRPLAGVRAIYRRVFGLDERRDDASPDG